MERMKLKVAVYVLVENSEKEVLFIRRVNTGWCDGYYTFPAGHIESGEFPEDAAIRELKEEVSIDASKENLELVHVLYEKDSYVDLYFKYPNFKGEVKVNGSKSADVFEWGLLSNLGQKLLVPKVKFVINEIIDGKNFSEIENSQNL